MKFILTMMTLTRFAFNVSAAEIRWPSLWIRQEHDCGIRNAENHPGSFVFAYLDVYHYPSDRETEYIAERRTTLVCSVNKDHMRFEKVEIDEPTSAQEEMFLRIEIPAEDSEGDPNHKDFGIYIQTKIWKALWEKGYAERKCNWDFGLPEMRRPLHKNVLSISSNMTMDANRKAHVERRKIGFKLEKQKKTMMERLRGIFSDTPNENPADNYFTLYDTTSHWQDEQVWEATCKIAGEIYDAETEDDKAQERLLYALSKIRCFSDRDRNKKEELVTKIFFNTWFKNNTRIHAKHYRHIESDWKLLQQLPSCKDIIEKRRNDVENLITKKDAKANPAKYAEKVLREALKLSQKSLAAAGATSFLPMSLPKMSYDS